MVIRREEIEAILESFGDQFDSETPAILQKVDLQVEVNRQQRDIHSGQLELNRAEKSFEKLKLQQIQLSANIASKVAVFRELMKEKVDLL